jgi:hypothetical protein
MARLTIRTNAAWIATVAVSLAGAGAGGVECSGEGLAPADAGSEASADAQLSLDVGSPDVADAMVDAYCAPNPPFDAAAHRTYDAAATCEAGFIGDAGVVSDWPGWVRPPGIEACCEFDVPGPDAGAPSMSWHACATEFTGCQEWLPAGPLVPGQPAALILQATASRDSIGNSEMLHLEMNDLGNLSGVLQDLFFDISSGIALGGWRVNGLGLNDGTSNCVTYSTPVGDSVALAWQNWFTFDMGLAYGTPAELMAGPGFISVPPNPRDTARYWGASATTYAFDTAFTAVVTRIPIATDIATSTPSCAPPLVFDFVAGDDVFAHLNDGSAWRTEYLVHADGSVALYRARADGHVSAFATDGTTMFWVESYGASDPTAVPTNFDVYAAPYTSDAATLDASATKVASYADPAAIPRLAVAFGGIYGVEGGGGAEFIVRRSDGASQTVQLPAGESFYWPLIVNNTEFWGTVRATSQHNVAVWRIPLAAW